jgi:hypothetical protein
MIHQRKPAVCIVNYNTCELLRASLRCVLAEDPVEVVVFDNASLDGSATMVEEEFPTVKVLSSGENIGYGAAANLAIAGCLAEYIVLLNGDALIKPGFLPAASNYLDRHATAAIVGPQIYNPDGIPQTSCFYFPTFAHIFLYLSGLYRLASAMPLVRERSLQAGSALRPGPVPWVLGAALAIRRTAFASAGGFDETFFLYFEEIDLCYRLARQGWQTHFEPAAQAIHIGAASAAQRPVETTIQYFSSLAHFYQKHYSTPALIALVALVEFFAFFRLCRDAVRSRLTRDLGQRVAMAKDIQVWRSLLLHSWSRGNTGIGMRYD